MSAQTIALAADPENLNPENQNLEPPVNAAVERCCRAMARAREAAIAAGKYPNSTITTDAFLHAMPPLSGAQNIRDFIACVSHAMMMNVILDSTGTRLLYAAQVALNALPKRSPRPRKQAASTACTPKDPPPSPLHRSSTPVKP